MCALFVGIAVHRDGLNAEFAQAPHDAHRDLAAIGDEHALKGRLFCHLSRRR
jgi:hypothetical protein